MFNIIVPLFWVVKPRPIVSPNQKNTINHTLTLWDMCFNVLEYGRQSVGFYVDFLIDNYQTSSNIDYILFIK